MARCLWAPFTPTETLPRPGEPLPPVSKIFFFFIPNTRRLPLMASVLPGSIKIHFPPSYPLSDRGCTPFFTLISSCPRVHSPSIARVLPFQLEECLYPLIYLLDLPKLLPRFPLPDLCLGNPPLFLNDAIFKDLSLTPAHLSIPRLFFLSFEILFIYDRPPPLIFLSLRTFFSAPPPPSTPQPSYLWGLTLLSLRPGRITQSHIPEVLKYYDAPPRLSQVSLHLHFALLF